MLTISLLQYSHTTTEKLPEKFKSINTQYVDLSEQNVQKFYAKIFC